MTTVSRRFFGSLGVVTFFGSASPGGGSISSSRRKGKDAARTELPPFSMTAKLAKKSPTSSPRTLKLTRLPRTRPSRSK